jgi:hypothetical protein
MRHREEARVRSCRSDSLAHAHDGSRDETGAAAVTRIWRAFGLQPHRQGTSTLSSDPMFVDKVRDIVGLYLNPPLKAMVLCVDEKSQIQALDRTQPMFRCHPVSLATHPRLHAPWHDHPVRGAGYRYRGSDRRGTIDSTNF